VCVAIDGLIERDFDSPSEIVVFITRAAGGKLLQQVLEVLKEERLVLVDREADRGVKRL